MVWREIKCQDFEEALLFLNEIAKVAEKRNHHPDIKIHSYRFVSIELYTHDTNSITEKDHELKREIRVCWLKIKGSEPIQHYRFLWIFPRYKR